MKRVTVYNLIEVLKELKSWNPNDAKDIDAVLRNLEDRKAEGELSDNDTILEFT